MSTYDYIHNYTRGMGHSENHPMDAHFSLGMSRDEIKAEIKRASNARDTSYELITPVEVKPT